jgi:hypothetical protein
MAITAAVPAPLNSAAPVLGRSGTFIKGPGDAQEPAWQGTVTFTGDGSTTSATINWIDGTKAIPFTPSAVEAVRVGGTDSAAGLPYITAATATTATIAWTAAPASTTTQIDFIAIYA